ATGATELACAGRRIEWFLVENGSHLWLHLAGHESDDGIFRKILEIERLDVSRHLKMIGFWIATVTRVAIDFCETNRVEFMKHRPENRENLDLHEESALVVGQLVKFFSFDRGQVCAVGRMTFVVLSIRAANRERTH